MRVTVLNTSMTNLGPLICLPEKLTHLHSLMFTNTNRNMVNVITKMRKKLSKLSRLVAYTEYYYYYISSNVHLRRYSVTAGFIVASVELCAQRGRGVARV